MARANTRIASLAPLPAGGAMAVAAPIDLVVSAEIEDPVVPLGAGLVGRPRRRRAAEPR